MSVLHQGINTPLSTDGTSPKTLGMSEDKALASDLKKGQQKFFYVSQDNYFFKLSITPNRVYYCDSATSCIVIIVTGRYAMDIPMLAMSHLSRPDRFKKFFELVERHFDLKKGINIHAAGANPPEPYEKTQGYDYTSRNNAVQVMDWVCRLASNKTIADAVRQVSQSYGKGDPSVYANNLDCFGIEYVSKESGFAVSNSRLYLTDNDRDPTGGFQTLFCMFGDKTEIRNQEDPFSRDDEKALVKAAREAKLPNALTMSDEEILKKYSSTPEYEVPWFCSSIRTAAKLSKDF